MPRRKTQQEVITEFREAHGDYYDYSSVSGATGRPRTDKQESWR